MSDKFLNKIWLNNHLRSVRYKAWPRYTPELNVNLPIADIFSGLGRTTDFYYSIREHYGKLTRAINGIKPNQPNERLTSILNSIDGHLAQLCNLVSIIKEYDVCFIHWENVKINAEKINELSGALAEELRQLNKEMKEVANKDNKQSPGNIYDSEIRHLSELQKESRFFFELSGSTKAKLSNSPFLLLTGSAGNGKTHLLCDILKNRTRQGYPTIMLFGEDFTNKRGIFRQIIDQLGIERFSRSKTELLKIMDYAGQKSKTRALIFIDALNDGPHSFWHTNIEFLINEIRKYKHIGLVISLRNGYENEILTDKAKSSFILEEHHGFPEEIMWDAISHYFKFYNVSFPEVPLLNPEFHNPLFLKFFCIKNKNSKPKLQGGNALKDIFEDFVIEIGLEVLKKFNPNAKKRSKGQNILWDGIVKDVALWMAQNGKTVILQDNLAKIIKKYFKVRNALNVINLLERRGLLHRFEWDSKPMYKFSYNKFSDHIIARTLLTLLNTKSERIAAFQENGQIGTALSQLSYDHGILEALCIWVPEFFDGKELFEMAPYLLKKSRLEFPFKESLIWRNPQFISKKAIDILKANIEKKDDFFMDPILSLSPFPNHPLNANFLHEILLKFSMGERDGWWTIFLNQRYGEQGSIDRLVEWAWSEQDKSHICDESIRLTSITLSWFLTSSNRFLRDKTTKALVSLLTNRLNLVTDILKQFKDVNDLYILERLYAVAYGCAIRNQEDKIGLKNLAEWIFENIFKDSRPPEHILLRDYARGVIETALHRKLKININAKKIRPPYKSKWLGNIPTGDELKQRYYPKDISKDRGYTDIWFSLMHSFGGFPGDFGNYVVGSGISRWSSRKLNEPRLPSRKEIYEDFEKNLNQKQRELWNKSLIHFSPERIIKIIRHGEETKMTEKEQEELEQNLKKTRENFKALLSKQQLKVYEEVVVPYTSSSSLGRDEDEFDPKIAQCWIFERVAKLGWSQKLHGQFDQYVNYNRMDRSAHKIERIGKKYQWIAYHEFLALVADNFEFKGDSWSGKAKKYEGTWQLNTRDIDPSCILKEQFDKLPKGLPSIQRWSRNVSYKKWDYESSNKEWLKRKDDLTFPIEKIIEITYRKNKWLILEGFLESQQEIPPEAEKYNFPEKRLWYFLKSYIVRKKDLSKIFKWVSCQDFMGRWMPESHEFYNIFLGEYPWAPAFLYHYVPYYNHDGWTNNSRQRKMPAKVLVTDDKYMSSGSSIDCSTSGTIKVKLPAKWLVDNMEIGQPYIDGRFFNSLNELIAFDPSVFEDSVPRILLINKNNFTKFLEKNGYSILWTLLGEKNIIGGINSDKERMGRLEISGAFYLGKQNRIEGNFKTKFVE